MTINVLVVDDSALVRAVLTEIINQAPDMFVVGAAKDAYVARDMVNQLTPDVITLDIQMPEISGLVFLERLMKARPTPVIMVSTLTADGAIETLQALEKGAVDYIEKPKISVAAGLTEYLSLLHDKIRHAAHANIQKPIQTSDAAVSSPIKSVTITESNAQKVIAIGASTGGTEAIKTVLQALPARFPPIIITQHMPIGFTNTFAERLDGLCKIRVKEAEDGESVLCNTAYIAKGDHHLTLVATDAGLIIQFDTGERVSGHKPSVNVMFDSVAQVLGQQAIGVLLTGMGKDGATGLLHMQQQGAITYAQDEASSVVFGMPKEALRIGAAKEAIPLHAIAKKIAIALAR